MQNRHFILKGYLVPESAVAGLQSYDWVILWVDYVNTASTASISSLVKYERMFLNYCSTGKYHL